MRKKYNNPRGSRNKYDYYVLKHDMGLKHHRVQDQKHKQKCFDEIQMVNIIFSQGKTVTRSTLTKLNGLQSK